MKKKPIYTYEKRRVVDDDDDVVVVVVVVVVMLYFANCPYFLGLTRLIWKIVIWSTCRKWHYRVNLLMLNINVMCVKPFSLIHAVNHWIVDINGDSGCPNKPNLVIKPETVYENRFYFDKFSYNPKSFNS